MAQIAEKPIKMTSSEVLWLLLRHVHSTTNGDELTYIPEFTTPSGSNRLDLLTISNWASHGYKRTAYEIKVSRADFLGELKRGSKTDAMLKTANYAYFVVPKGLVSLTEVPAGCGLIEVTKQGCSYARKAPQSEITVTNDTLLREFTKQAVRRYPQIQALFATEGEPTILPKHIDEAKAAAYRLGLEDGKKRAISQFKIADVNELKTTLAVYEAAIREVLGLEKWERVTPVHADMIKVLKDNSPTALKAYEQKVSQLVNSAIKSLKSVVGPTT